MFEVWEVVWDLEVQGGLFGLQITHFLPIYVGGTSPSYFHINAVMQGFPAQHCIVTSSVG